MQPREEQPTPPPAPVVVSGVAESPKPDRGQATLAVETPSEAITGGTAGKCEEAFEEGTHAASQLRGFEEVPVPAVEMCPSFASAIPSAGPSEGDVLEEGSEGVAVAEIKSRVVLARGGSSGQAAWKWKLSMALIAITIAVAASALWWRPHSQTALDLFWGPVLQEQRTVIICAGSSGIVPKNRSGVAAATVSVDMQTASAVAEVSGTMERSGAATQLENWYTTALIDLREHPVVLLGGYGNDWTLRLVAPLRYHFAPVPDNAIVDQTQPHHWQRDQSLPYSNADDYALVARFRDPAVNGWVVAAAGLGSNGTEAAARFITSPQYMELLRDQVGSGFADRNIEAVLKVSVINGRTGDPSILAVYSW